MLSDLATRVLPVRVRVYEDESGQSFLFRSFAANALSFRTVGSALGIRSWIPLPEKHVATLASICRCNHGDLMSRCCVSLGARPHRSYRFMSHAFGEGSISIRRSARICPICVKQRKYAKAAWQLRGIVGCNEHGLLLREKCPVCHRLIWWNRPDIDVCDCGYFLTATLDLLPLPNTISNWNRWFQLRFENKAARASDFDLPRGLDGLSLDSCFHVVLSLGLLECSDSSLALANRKIKSCDGMAEAIGRGIERFRTLEDGSVDNELLIEVVHMPALERLRSAALSLEDARSVSWIFEHIIRRSGRNLNGSGWYAKRQFSLF